MTITPATLGVALYVILSVAGIVFILWLAWPRHQTMQEIVAQRGPLHVFPELRLPKSFMKEPKELTPVQEFALGATIMVLLAYVLRALAGSDHHHSGCDDDY